MTVLQLKVDSFVNAVISLEKAVVRAEYDADLQDLAKMRFVYCQEYSWKVIRAVAKYEKLHEATTQRPRELYETAFKLGLIEDTAGWLAMANDRNQLAHVYDEQEATAIYYRIREQYLPRLQGLRDKLKATYG